MITRYSLASQSPLRKEREGVWSNAYRARVSVHRTVRANQIQVSLLHDNRSTSEQTLERYVINYVVLINARRKRKFNEHSSGTRALYAFDQTPSRSLRRGDWLTRLN